MASRINIIIGFLSHYKYLIVFVLGILLVGVVDENSFRKRIQYDLQISDLKNEIKKYEDQYEESAKRLNSLTKDPDGIEHIARERYFMKLDDEDIYVLSTDNNTSNSSDDEATE